MPRKSITGEEYARLAGLLTAAKQHNEAIDVINRQAREITGDEEFGHTFDAIIGPIAGTVDKLLGRLGIRVEGHLERARG